MEEKQKGLKYGQNEAASCTLLISGPSAHWLMALFRTTSMTVFLSNTANENLKRNKFLAKEEH